MDSPADARVWIDKQTPEAFHALSALTPAISHAAEAAGLDRSLIELVNVRVSQLNGCPFCLNLHTRAAVTAGVTQQQLDVLPAWRRTDLFTPLERAALGLAELTTELPDEQTLERGYAIARQQMSDDQVSVVIWAATTIGAFNRVSIMSRHPVRARKES
ncbi:carboxymuconolactone decarboxylase family protein [Nocardia sp. NEAU-G5]|uniref:Carboxymuconolactone decarboxylase family protein n=1 Tax=Nocardia albiluteola TaxID=2842303 RepID=A0ABS6ASN5_9NOCA|nr:carboxymuconolactone decarboxylase family protein [Nocardia albiluteola]MBU3060908.1 carboxymuconolactone decarboxylase family protein [Nocardia albiluteola]